MQYSDDLKHFVLCPSEYHKCLPRMDPLGSKGKNGRPLLAVGSQKYHGAAIFATYASQCAGADYTYVITHGNKVNVVSQASPDAIVQQHEGISQLDSLYFTSLLVGCGLDRNETAEALYMYAVEVAIYKKTTVVVDADGLYFFQKTHEYNKSKISSARFVLTPNQREFNNLFRKVLNREPTSYNGTFSNIKSDQSCHTIVNLNAAVKDVYELATQLSCCILVKNSVDICVYQQKCMISYSLGAPKRCSGQGDILAGLIVALVNYSDDIVQYVIFACEVLKKSAHAAFHRKRISMTASDVITEILAILFEMCPYNMQHYKLIVE